MITLLVVRPVLGFSSSCQLILTNSDEIKFFSGKKSVSESDLLKFSMTAIYNSNKSQSYLSKKIESIIHKLIINKSFRDQVLIEMERRNLNKIAEMLEIPVDRDLSSILRDKRNYISSITTILLNVVTNVYANVTFAYLPELKFLDLTKISDDTLIELITSPNNKSNASIQSLKLTRDHKKQFVYDQLKLLFNTAMIIYILTEEYKLFMHPEAFVNDVANQMYKESYETNLNSIAKAKVKVEYYMSINDIPNVEKFKQLIEKIEAENIETLRQMNRKAEQQ